MLFRGPFTERCILGDKKDHITQNPQQVGGCIQTVETRGVKYTTAIQHRVGDKAVKVQKRGML